MMTNLRSSSVARLRFLLVILVMMFATTEMWGAEDDTHNFSQSISQSLNNCATFDDIVISEQDYSIKSVIITYAYNKSASPKATVSIGNEEIGTLSFGGTGNLTTTKTLTFTPNSPIKGEVRISNTAGNSCSGTGKGTLKITNICLVEGSSTNPPSPHIVKFYITSTQFKTEQETSAGDGVFPPSMAQKCGDWTFQGWSESDSNSETNTTGLDLVSLTDGKYYPIDDVKLYPVYSKTISSGNSFSSYKKVTTNLDDWSGKYLLSTGTYTATGVYSNNHLTCTNGAPGNVECSGQEFTLSKVGNVGYSILMPNGNYLGYSGSSTNFSSSPNVPTSTSTTFLWTPSTSGISNVSATARKISTNNDNTDFRPYSSPSSGIVYLYKRIENSSTTYYYSYPSCTAEPTVSEYTVKHYQQNITDDNYTLKETETLSGEVGTQVTPAVKSYTGFKAPSTQTVTIKSDGSTAVTYQYTRNSYTLKWVLDGGKVTTAGTAASIGATGTISQSVRYGTSITAPVVERDDYKFDKWDSSVSKTMPASDKTFTAQWTRVYTINLNSVQNGTISTNQTTAAAGEIVTLTATPHDGYRFGSWTVKDANGNTIAMEVSNSNTFKMPESNVTVSATFNKPILSFVTQPDDPIKFNAVNCGSNTPKADAEQVEVKGENLVGKVSVEVTGPYKIAKTDADIKDYTTTLELDYTQDGAINANYDLIRIISCPPAGKSDPTTGTLTFTTKNGNILTVNLYTPTVNCAEYTIKWMVNGVVHASQTALRGTEINVPENPSNDICDGKKFVGWTTTRINEPQDEAPAFISEFGTITSDQTYYAVFATEGGGEPTTEEIYTNEGTIEPSNDITTNGNVNTSQNNGNPAPCFGLTSATHKTITISNINTSGYNSVTLSFDHKIGSYSSTYPTLTINCGNWTKTIKGSNNQYTTVSYNDFPIGTNLELTLTISAASGTNYSQTYLDNIKLIGTKSGSTTYSGYITNCTQVPDPTWVAATITHTAIKANCGSTTVLGAAGENGPATISFGGTDLQSSVTVTASDGFLVSTDKTAPEKYAKSIIIYPNSTGNNIGKITQNVHVIAQAPAQSGNYDGTITLTGNDIPNGSQVINVTAAVTCTQYTLTWSVSGDTEIIEPTTFYAGGDWELPENPTFECNGREFVGWTNTEILQPQNIAPNVLYKEQRDFPTIESNTTFYAVFAKGGTDDGTGTATVMDILNRDLTGVISTNTYSDWSGKTATSSAVYAGNSCGGNSSIQLRSNENSAGIVTTTSGGKARNVTVVWNTKTASGRTLNIYGKNSAYSAATDLYGDNAGTLIGSITYNTSTTITIDGDYEYIGIRSNSGAMYLTSISIQWETDGEGDGNATTYTSYTTSCADVKAIRIVEPTTKTFNEGDKFVFDGEVWAINKDGNETDVTNSPYVRYDVDMYKVGTQTVTVSYLGFTATYEITINAVDKWQITWNVSGATNTGLSPVTVAKGTAIGTPPTPKAIPSGCTGKSFIGWTESNVVNADGSDITYLQPSDIPTKHTTYYAVFATPSGDDNVGNIFYELFNTNEGIGGNDEIWNNIKTSTAVSIDGWSFTKGYVANQCIRLGTGDVAGSATTPALGINGSATLTFNAGAWDGNNEKLNIVLNIIGEGHIEPSTFTLTKGQFNTYTANITGANANTKVQFIAATTSDNRFFLDEVRVSEVNGNTTYTDYTTGCHDVTITYYGFTGGYTTNCGGSDLNVITQRVNSSHTIPYCTEITDPTTLGRTFLGTWKDQNGKERKPGDNFIVTENITFYAQWALNTSGNTTLPTDVEDLANTDIVVTGGNTLTLGAGTTTIKSLTLKGGIQADGSYKMPIIYIPDNANLKRKSDIIYLDLVVNAKNYYPFAVPFRAKNGSAKADWDYVGYIDPVLKGAATYRTHFVIKTYDGAKRAENGENRDANWAIVNRDTYLEPGVGYMITAMTYAGKDTVTMRIPMRVSDDWFAGGEQTTLNEVTRNAVTVTAHTGEAAEEHQRHAGWNFVASPYLSQFAGNNVENNGAFINGEILIQPGFDYGGDNVPYVTIPAYDFSYYEQVKLSDVTLSPEYSFFVQIGKDGTMSFATVGRQQAPAHLAARAAEQPIKMDVDITLSDDNHSDQTGLIICDRFSDAYEIGHDLEKMFGSAYNLSVYTLMADNTPLAFQALAIQNSMQVIPVGYRTPAQGEYTFALNEATSDIELLNEQYEQLILVDYETGALTNMLNNEYTFYSDRTQSNNRFALYAVPRQNTTTDLPNTIGNEEVKKVIYNDHFYILRDGKVFNGAGQIVK